MLPSSKRSPIGKALLASELKAAAIKFEALFNQSGIFAGIIGSSKVTGGRRTTCHWIGAVTRGTGTEPTYLGHRVVARFGRCSRRRIRFATAQAAAGIAFRERLRYWLADGSGRMVDFTVQPIRDPSGAIVFLHPTGIDITERKHCRSGAH